VTGFVLDCAGERGNSRPEQANKNTLKKKSQKSSFNPGFYLVLSTSLPVFTAIRMAHIPSKPKTAESPDILAPAFTFWKWDNTSRVIDKN